MRRGQVGILLAVTSGLFSVLLAVAVNVATGGSLPAPLAAVSWLAWPVVGALAAIGIGLAVWQQRLADAPSAVDVAVPVTTRARPAELPAAARLFGRDEDLAALDALLRGETPVVVLAAAPGTGKTSLALRAAHDARARFPDGQLFARLLGASAAPLPPEAVLARFLGALGVPEDEHRGGVDELAARFRSAVADRAVLVVLDDARDAEQVTPLLPGGRRCATLVTSRRQLAAVPGATMVALRAVPDDDALALLAATAGERRIAADPEGARQLVAACAGLPLALRIVGGRLRDRTQWTPSALAARLADERRRLDELRRGDVAVRSTFRTVYDELATGDRLVFRRAGSYPGQVFALDAAAARAGVDRDAAARALDRLVDAFLVESPEPDRFRLHDLLRLFAAETLHAEEPSDGVAGCLRRLMLWQAATVATGGWPPQERDNVFAILREAIAEHLYAEALALVDAANRVLADPFDRLALWELAVTAAAGAGDDLSQARALRWVSHSLSVAGDVRRALPPAEEALALAEAAGDPWETAQSVRRHGEALRGLMRLEESEEALLRALDLFDAMGETVEEVEVRAALGTLYNNFWRYEQSLPILERARELLPATESSLHGWVLLPLALAHKLAGRRAESAALGEEAFAVAGRIGDDYLLGYCHQERGWFAEGDGRYDDAERDFRQMLAIFERIGDGGGVAGAHDGLAELHVKRGELAAALAEYDFVIEAHSRLGDRIREGSARRNRAAVLTGLDRAAEAQVERARGDALVGDLSVPWAGPGDNATILKNYRRP